MKNYIHSSHAYKALFFCLFIVIGGCQTPKQKNYEIKVSKEQKENLRNKIFLREYADINGNTIKVGELKAQIIIVNFWASWCGPCMEEMPSMMRLKKNFSNDELQIISINVEKENQLINIKKTYNKLGITNEFFSVPDIQLEIAHSVGFTTIPMTVFFHKGEVIRLQDGPMNFDSYEVIQTMKKLLE